MTTPGGRQPDKSGRQKGESSDNEWFIDGKFQRPINSVVRAGTILNLLGNFVAGLPLTTIADMTGIPKGSVHRHLTTLRILKYVEQDPKAQLYRISAYFAGKGPNALDLLLLRVGPHLERLRNKTEETAAIGILYHGAVLLADMAESLHLLRTSAPPDRLFPLHATAAGKAVLAYQSEEMVRDALAWMDIHPQIEETFTTVSNFLDELARIRERGYAIDDCEYDPYIRWVAAPIPDTDPPAAICVSGPAPRFTLQDAEMLGEPLRDVAMQIAGPPRRHNARPDPPAPTARPSRRRHLGSGRS